MKERLVSIHSLSDLLEKIPNEDAARLYLENLIGLRCPYCYRSFEPSPTQKDRICTHSPRKKKEQQTEPQKNKKTKKKKKYRKSFNVFLGTEFEHTHVPFRKWLIAIFLFLFKEGKPINAHVLSKDLGINWKTASEMLKKLEKLNNKDYSELRKKEWRDRYNLPKGQYDSPPKEDLIYQRKEYEKSMAIRSRANSKISGQTKNTNRTV